MKPRLVVKVGTSTLLEEHELPTSTFDGVAGSIKAVLDEFDVVLVSSGATGFGVREIGLSERPQDLHQLQALASIGQVKLMERWRTALAGYKVGQVLVTARELNDEAESSMLNATFQAMWSMGVIPIVNENDAVTNEEFTFGDNDKLSALVAITVSAEYLVLLTDQNGIYADFGTDTQRRVSEITAAESESYIIRTQSLHGTGGMATKIMAAQMALDNAIQPFITDARDENSIRRALSGESGTKLI